MSVGGGTGKFIAKKVRKVRWKPKSDTSQTSSNIFVTGSWDDQRYSNSLCSILCGISRPLLVVPVMR